MPKTAAQRMALYRSRQQAGGMATLSLLVPAQDVDLFTQFAAERRKAYSESPAQSPEAPEVWAALQKKITPAATGDKASYHHSPDDGIGQPSHRAEALVALLIKRIADLGWPVDHPLGSEPELMRTYGVSRAVLRQAIRLLEHQSIARMQRGTGGGLVVAQPDLRATGRAARVYLEYAGIQPRDILATRKILELAVVELVTQRLDSMGEQRLREQVAAEALLDGRAEASQWMRFHFLLGELCEDPALQLFGNVVLQLADTHSTFHYRSMRERDEVIARIKRFHQDIAEALISRNKALAGVLMARYIDGIRSWLK